MTATLQGLRVIDAASFLAGPCAATILSDYGADVIKIEPLAGDGHRRLSGGHPIDYTWQLTGRNKRSLALDFSQAAGRDVLLKLVASADVLLVNLRADQMQRYGLTWEALRALNPRIVYCAITGYGQDGPRAQVAAHDLNYVAESGMLSLAAGVDGAPVVPPALIADIAGGAYPAVMNILLALRQRDRDGVHYSFALH